MNQIAIALVLLVSLAATSDAFARGGGSRGGSGGSHTVKGYARGESPPQHLLNRL